MNSYAEVAKRVVREFKSGRATNPRESWESNARVEFVGRKAAQMKNCPMSALRRRLSKVCAERCIHSLYRKQEVRNPSCEPFERELQLD